MSYTYTTLKSAIKDYTDNQESTFVSHFVAFIRSAEERIFKSVDLEFFRKNVTWVTTSGNQFFAVPDDYLASFSVSVENSGVKQFLLFKDVNFLQEYNPNSATGTPKYYGVYDYQNFLLSPTPDAVYSAELHYYYRPASITAGADGGTTWISTNAPFALLYGSLIEAYYYMKGEPDVLAQYEKNYVFYIERLKDLGEARENTDGYKVGLPSRPRT